VVDMGDDAKIPYIFHSTANLRLFSPKFPS